MFRVLIRCVGLKRKFLANLLLVAVVLYAAYCIYYELSKQICIEPSLNRTNNLLQILQDKEAQFKQEFEVLGVPVLYKILEHRDTSKFFALYRRELDFYCQFENGYLYFNQEMINGLGKLSKYYSFDSPVRVFPLIEPVKRITIVTAANQKYFEYLLTMMKRIIGTGLRPKFVIYDLGLNSSSFKRIRRKFPKLELIVKKFSQIPILLPLITNLNIYAWKPIIIQDVFKDLEENESFVYMDTAVMLNSKDIQAMIDLSQDTGFVLSITRKNFSCHTNPKIFEWFKENPQNYTLMQSHIHAALITVTKNFLSTIIMKAWVTCALDEDCISPADSRLAPCCGCHRFDQSALQIILTHFYSYPTKSNLFLPPYGHDIENRELFQFYAFRP